jgi:hypothetical protein
LILGIFAGVAFAASQYIKSERYKKFMRGDV